DVDDVQCVVGGVRHVEQAALSIHSRVVEAALPHVVRQVDVAEMLQAHEGQSSRCGASFAFPPTTMSMSAITCPLRLKYADARIALEPGCAATAFSTACRTDVFAFARAWSWRFAALRSSPPVISSVFETSPVSRFTMTSWYLPSFVVYTESCNLPSSISNFPDRGLPVASAAARPCSSDTLAAATCRSSPGAFSPSSSPAKA